MCFYLFVPSSIHDTRVSLTRVRCPSCSVYSFNINFLNILYVLLQHILLNIKFCYDQYQFYFGAVVVETFYLLIIIVFRMFISYIHVGHLSFFLL